MPKAILEFNLPEEQSEHMQAVRAGDYLLALQDLDQELRAMVKYESTPDFAQTPLALAEHIRQRFFSILNDRGITLDP